MFKKIFNPNVALIVIAIDLLLFFMVPWRSNPWSFETGCCGDSLCLTLCEVHYSLLAKMFLTTIGVTFFMALGCFLGFGVQKIIKFLKKN